MEKLMAYFQEPQHLLPQHLHSDALGKYCCSCLDLAKGLI